MLTLILKYSIAANVEDCVGQALKNGECIVTVDCQTIPSQLSSEIIRRQSNCMDLKTKIHFKIDKFTMDKNAVEELNSISDNMWEYFTKFEMINGDLKEFPIQLYKATKVEHINLSYNEIHTQPNLNNFTNLKIINFSNNNFDTNIDLTNLNNLIAIDFSYNRIPGIVVGDGSLNLEDINLTHNKLTSFPDLRKLTKLQRCDLSQNSIESKLILANFNSLINFNVSHNLISELQFEIDDNVNPINLKDIDLSYNALNTLPDAYFKNFENLARLDLSHNKIKGSLSITQFQGLGSLRKLYLSHNNIKDIGDALLKFEHLDTLQLGSNEITSLSNETFKVTTELKELNLSSNAIADIHNESFKTLKKLKKLDLQNNKMTKINAQMFKENKELEKLFISNNRISFIEPGSFKNNKINELTFDNNNLQGPLDKTLFEGLLISELDLSNRTITEVKPQCFTFLNGTLIRLNLSNNAIKEISGTAFENLNLLEELDLSHNELTELELPDFGFDKLQILDASSNKITRIKGDTIKNLKSVSQLNLSNNNITELKSTFLNKLSNLKSFKCSQCQLANLDKEAFNEIISLEFLDLSHNLLTEFTINVTQNMNINNLFLNDNKLQSINFIKKMVKLKQIDLARNNIQEIRADIFGALVDLNYIDLSSNENLTVSNHFENLPALIKVNISKIKEVNFENVTNTLIKSLDLSFTGIKDLNLVKIHNIKNIERLLLNDNDLTMLSKDLFNGMNSLMLLDLSRNKIIELKSDIFEGSQHLEELNFHENKISSIESRAFAGLSNLKNLDLSKNEISVIFKNSFIHNSNIEILDLHSNIINLLYYKAFSGLNHLKKLNLADNKLYDFGPWFLPSELSETDIILNNNSIKHIRFDEFSVTKVRSLSIGGNPIPCTEIEKAKKDFPKLTAITVHDYQTACASNTEKPPTTTQKISTSIKPISSVEPFKISTDKSIKSEGDVEISPSKLKFYYKLRKDEEKDIKNLLDTLSNIRAKTKVEHSVILDKIKSVIDKSNSLSKELLKKEGKSFKVLVYIITVSLCVIAIVLLVKVILYIKVRKSR